MADASRPRGGSAVVGVTRAATSRGARGGLRRSGAAATVEVGALGLSIPGTDAAFGRRVAERVGAGLAERCPRGLAGDLGALSLRVPAGGALTEEGLGDSIVEAVVAALGRF
ncbi:MAG TPA: hypothetical protein VIF57_25680 [Polyangia bacterium]|jgi:hypothetical protein